MREPVVVVGSGAAGVHCALTLLEAGCRVLMVDVGRTGVVPPLPSAPVSELKSRLTDSQEFFLGADLGAIRLPGDEGEYYALPPSKRHVLEFPKDGYPQMDGFAPALSFARGGLGEAWTGGCYPFDDDDLRAFPLTFGALQPSYEQVARRIGISGTDDLVPHIPIHAGIQPPLELDRHSESLLQVYQRNLKGRSEEIHLGHARSAVISEETRGRTACGSLGRCLWGCPTSSFYVPSLTLNECLEYDEFDYRPGLRVSHAVCDSQRRINAIVASDGRADMHSIQVGTLILAAGTLSTSAVYLRTLAHAGETDLVLSGLMDNRQMHIPFLTPRLFGRPVVGDAYQYHRLAMVVEDAQLSAKCHGQLTTLKAAMAHPMLQRLPTGLGNAVRLFRNVRSGMGLLNLSFPDTRRPENRLRLVQTDGAASGISIEYRPPAGERQTIARVERRVRRFMRKLGCHTFGFWNSSRVMGASIHYAGTLPMSATPVPRTVSHSGNSHDFPNLWVVDASVFPSLPAKSLTLTIMANAVRIAKEILQ